jgi:hypothetical protein
MILTSLATIGVGGLRLAAVTNRQTERLSNWQPRAGDASHSMQNARLSTIANTFHCKMIGLASCCRQAAVKYAACLRGDPIPPLNY